MTAERIKNFDCLSPMEERWVDEFSRALRGYDIPCRFCGYSSAEHEIADHREDADLDPDPEWLQKKHNARLSLWECPGYVPADILKWRKRYKADP